MEDIKRINIMNKKEIEDINIHDTYFRNISINSIDKCILIDLYGADDKKYALIFNEIFQCNLSRIALWGGEENRILGIYVDENYNIEEYINNKIENENRMQKRETNFKCERDISKALTFVIYSNDGDKLCISCEEVIFVDIFKKIEQ